MDVKKILLNIWITIIFIIIIIQIIFDIHYDKYNYKKYINFTKCLINELIKYYNITNKYEQNN